MDMEKKSMRIHLPPGFRFYPTDEELIFHYLRRKVAKIPLPAPSVVNDIELYRYDPWDLPKKDTFGEDEYYFFTPRERKYPNGMRPNRMVASGYWKAIGIDKPILSSCDSKVVGVKKALVFYTGRPPKGNRTNWTMVEYRLPLLDVTNREKSMKLDDWVLCRIQQKPGIPTKKERNGSSPTMELENPEEISNKDDEDHANVSTEMVRKHAYRNNFHQDHNYVYRNNYMKKPFNSSVSKENLHNLDIGNKRKHLDLGNQSGIINKKAMVTRLTTDGQSMLINSMNNVNYGISYAGLFNTTMSQREIKNYRYSVSRRLGFTGMVQQDMYSFLPFESTENVFENEELGQGFI